MQVGKQASARPPLKSVLHVPIISVNTGIPPLPATKQSTCYLMLTFNGFSSSPFFITSGKICCLSDRAP